MIRQSLLPTPIVGEFSLDFLWDRAQAFKMDFGTILLISLAALNLLILAALYFRRRVDIDPEVLRPQFENISNEARRIEQQPAPAGEG